MTAQGIVERSSIFEAMTILTSAGYVAEKVYGIPNFFDIYAWRGNRTLCIAVRSSRHAKLSAFRENVHLLSKMIATGTVPGEIQFWIYRPSGWVRWKITEGGAVPIEDWDNSATEVASV